MISIAQIKFGATSLADPQAYAFNSNVTAGNRLFGIFALHSFAVYVNTITDDQGNTWKRLYGEITYPFLPTLAADCAASIWTTVAGSSASCTVTFDLTGTPGAVGAYCLIEASGWTKYATVGAIARNTQASGDPIPIGSTAVATDSIVIAMVDVLTAYSGASTIDDSFTIGVNATNISLSYRLASAGASLSPILTTGASHAARTILFAIYEHDLPYADRTGWWDSSESPTNLYAALDLSSNPTGAPLASGDQLGYWINRNQLYSSFRPNTSDAGTEDISWQDDSAMNQPSVKFSQGRLIESTGMSHVLPKPNKTLIFSFKFDIASTVPSTGTIYYRLEIAGMGRDWSFGVMVGESGGVYTLYPYNYDGNADTTAGIVFDPAESHVCCIRLGGGTMYFSLDDPTLASEQTVATGASTDNGQFYLGDTGLAGGLSGEFKGRIGEVVTYEVLKTGTELADLYAYFAGRWLLLPTVNAGPNQTIQLPPGAATLAGSITNQGDTFSTLWTKDSGPSGLTFSDDTGLTPGVTVTAPGTYVLRLTLTYDGGAIFDTMTLIVAQQLNPCDGGGTVEIGADPADGAAMATSKTPEVWVVFHLESGDLPVSALPLPDPPTYHGGHKYPRLLDLGALRLAVSDQFGGPQTSDHTVTVIDTDYRFRSKQTTETLEGRTYTVWMADDATRRAQGVARRRGHFVINSVEPVGDMTYRIHGSDFIGSVLSRFYADKKLHDRALNRTLFPQLPLALDGKVQPGYYGWIGDDSLATLEVDPVTFDHTQGYGGILDGGIYTDWGWGTVGIAGPSGITLGESAGGVYGAGDDAFVFVTAVVGGIETDPFPLTDAAGEQFSFSGSGKKLTLACPAVTGATAYRWYVIINAQWGHTATPRDAKVRMETAGNSTELTDAGNENVGPFPPPDTNWTGVAATGQGYFVVIARYPDGLTPRQTIAGQVKWGPWASRPSRIGWTAPASLPDEYWVISVIGNMFVNKWVVANTETFLDLTLASAPDEVLNGTFVQEGAIPLYYAGDEVIAGTAYRIFLASLGVIRINALHGSDVATPASRIQLDASVYGSTFLVPGKTGWPFATLYRTLVDEVGEDQWFTLVYGLSGNAIVEAAVDGTVPLTANTCGFAEDSRGVDDDGNASPTIDALADQTLHFLENFANPQDGLIWKSGPWKTPHTRNGVAVHRGSAFQTARDYADTLVSGGFKGAWGFAVNLEPFDLGTWLRAAAINHDWRWNTNEHGQLEPLMIDPDASAAAAFSDGSVLGVAAANIPHHAVPVYVPSAARRVNEISYVYKKNYVSPVTKPTPAEDDLLPPKLSESVDWYSGTVLERNDASQFAFGGGSGRRDVKPLEVQFAMHRTGTGPATIVERFLARWGFPPDVWRFPASLLGVDVKNGQLVTWTHHAGAGSAGAVARRLWLAASELNPNIDPGDSASLDVWLEGEDITDLT